MTTIPAKNREYLLIALSGTPVILLGLLDGLKQDSPVWDRVVEQDRFTLREILAHLADIEPVFLGRIERIHKEDSPMLPNFDEEKAAIDHDYAHSDVEKSFARFQTVRARLIGVLEGLPEDAWLRTGVKDGVTWTLHQWVVQTLAHDGYHLRQAAEWIRRSGEG
ncbi:MAG: DinB family protein [Capsulimonadaceae bacterium]|nr:DinB family protein [Capsulimonadaceae bacterium]